ncbi:hypothetical protein BBJ28_00012486, partial [Nothophytophthora sp. Chile5]
LFDDVILLNDGYVVYNGPREQALGYFESLGFKCPPGRDVADFMMDLGTNKQHQYDVGAVPTTAREFADVFERSDIHERMVEALLSPPDPFLIQDNEKRIKRIPEFHQSFTEGAATLVDRELKVLIRNTSAVKSRVLMAAVIGLLYGTAFYQFDSDNSQVVMGLAYTAADTLSVAQCTVVPSLLAVRGLIYKQRGANMYRASSFVIASSVRQVPVALTETLIFGSLVYWMCGFVPTAAGYLLFQLVLFLVNMVFASLFFVIASISPNINVANPIAMLMLLFFATYSGFLVTKDTIPVYLTWVYWLSPLGWGVRAIAVNQYTDSRFATCVYAGMDYCNEYGMQAGEYLLSSYGVPAERYWVWYGLMYLVGIYVFFMVLSCLALEHWRFENSDKVVLADEAGDESAIDVSVSDEYGVMLTPKAVSMKLEEEKDVAIPVAQSAEKDFVPVTIAFRDLWYSVPDPARPKGSIDLLKGISGFALPGTMTALMGSSGAGKTTLMDVIAGRKTGGSTRGQIFLNGHPATDLALRRSTGYCEQMDIHSDASTFREALTFSAFLRQGADIPDSKKYASVNECLELLDLNSIADQIIRGSSTEQMKRLTIGVELAAQPSVLFLDEPTSGLDARSAKLIMDELANVASTGRTIVCTIHQPSAEVFKVFDSLLLLKRGGETVFFGDTGEQASELINYFEAIEGVATMQDDHNPATWVLEVIGAGIGKDSSDTINFAGLFQTSEQSRRLETDLDREGVARPSPSLSALVFSGKRAASNATQAKFVILRFFNLYWRTASYNLTRFFIAIVLGVLFGITYIGAEYSSYQGINSGLGMVFMTASYITFITFNGVLPITLQERTAYYRERAAQTYDAFWYFAGATLVEIPYCFVETLVFMIFFFPMVGFTGVAQFLSYWVNMSLLVLLQAYFGQFLAYLLPNMDVASVFVILINYIWILFTGFNPPVASIPRGYMWLHHITPHKYTFASLTAIVFGDCPSSGDGSELGCQVMTNTPPTLTDSIMVKEYLEEIFLVKHSEIWTNCGIVVLWIICLRIASLLSLRYINHQKK